VLVLHEVVLNSIFLATLTKTRNSQGLCRRGWPGRVRCACRTAACAESRKCHRNLENLSIAEASGAPEWRAQRRRALGRQGSVTFEAGMIPGNLVPTASKILCAPELLPAQTVIWTVSQTVGQTLRVAALGSFGEPAESTTHRSLGRGLLRLRHSGITWETGGSDWVHGEPRGRCRLIGQMYESSIACWF
jgi:hypothetical protein